MQFSVGPEIPELAILATQVEVAVLANTFLLEHERATVRAWCSHGTKTKCLDMMILIIVKQQYRGTSSHMRIPANLRDMLVAVTCTVQKSSSIASRELAAGSAGRVAKSAQTSMLLACGPCPALWLHGCGGGPLVTHPDAFLRDTAATWGLWRHAVLFLGVSFAILLAVSLR